MKRNLIKKLDEHHSVVCDNPECSFQIKYAQHGFIIEEFINVPCPLCGENLLTQKDYNDFLRLIKFIDFINKWFSWITIFYSKKTLNKTKQVSIKVHDGLEIKPLD